jgi:hypothetical protein
MSEIEKDVCHFCKEIKSVQRTYLRPSKFSKTNLDKINFKSICGGTLSVEEGGFTFSYLNYYCEFWTSTDLIVDIVSSKLFCVYFYGYSLEENKIMGSFSEPKNSARYVRCVKD